MQVILLERIEKLGSIGSVVKVTDGFARNFLLPRGKAIRATNSNLEKFEKQRAEVEKQNAENKAKAEGLVEKVSGKAAVIIRQAGEDGRLYGSVTARDIAQAITDATSVNVDYHMVHLQTKFKEIGIYQIDVLLHPEVKVAVSLNIARSDEEAKAANAKAEKSDKAEKKAAE
jgi:large subunit ribosomal protein L9